MAFILHIRLRCVRVDTRVCPDTPNRFRCERPLPESQEQLKKLFEMGAWT